MFSASKQGWLGVPILDKDGINIGLLQLSNKFAGDFNTKDEYLAIELAQIGAGALNNFKLLAQMRALDLSNSELKIFAHAVAHDLRSPLNTIDGFNQVLAKEIKGTQNNKVHQCLTRIHSGVVQMGGLIDSMLALVIPTQINSDCETFNLSQASNNILQHLKMKDQWRKVKSKIQQNLSVQGDSRLLESVMQNLLSNAWKFTAEKDCSIIEVGYSDEKKAFFVKDNGVGFNSKDSAALFEYYQRMPTAQGYAGTGIGLASAARAVAHHGGKIWAESSPDCGATFFFTFSLTQPPL